MRTSPRSIPASRAQRGLQCNYSLAACVFFAALAFGASDLSAEEGRVYYKFTDDDGRLNIVQSLDRVPVQYRNQIGEIALEGDPLWTKTAAQPPAMRSQEEYEPAVRTREEYKPVKRRAVRSSSGVVLYYADWCGYCKKAKRWLDERNVAYDLRDVDVSRYGEELSEVSGSKSVPVLTIGGDVVRGFNPDAYERALGS
jgi:glutaredoxin